MNKWRFWRATGLGSSRAILTREQGEQVARGVVAIVDMTTRGDKWRAYPYGAFYARLKR